MNYKETVRTPRNYRRTKKNEALIEASVKPSLSAYINESSKSEHNIVRRAYSLRLRSGGAPTRPGAPAEGGRTKMAASLSQAGDEGCHAYILIMYLAVWVFHLRVPGRAWVRLFWFGEWRPVILCAQYTVYVMFFLLRGFVRGLVMYLAGTLRNRFVFPIWLPAVDKKIRDFPYLPLSKYCVEL